MNQIWGILAVVFACAAGCTGGTGAQSEPSLPDTAALRAGISAQRGGIPVTIDGVRTYRFPRLGEGAASSVSVISLAFGDSGEIKVFAPDSHGAREFFSTGVLPRPDGCGALQWMVLEVRQLGTGPYPLIAVLERHIFDPSYCIGNDYSDTTLAILFDARKLDRRLLTLEDALVNVETRGCDPPPPGVECSQPDTVTVRHSEYTVDDRGLHVSQLVSKGAAGIPRTVYSWNRDSTALLPKP